MKIQERVQPPIFHLRNSFHESLESVIGQKIPREIEKMITLDLTPTHVVGNFTFPIFEIAKVLKVDYFKFASDVAKNLKSFKKYIREVAVVNGFINVTVSPTEFYIDSLRYVLCEKLLQEVSKGQAKKTILLVSGLTKKDLLINQPILRFINRLYALPPYIIKTSAINGNASYRQTQSFLRELIKSGKVTDFGNNVIATYLSKDKSMLLQKQDQTPTTLLCQLTSLKTYLKKHNPTLVIFSISTTPQSIYDFLAVSNKLHVFSERTRLIVINNSDIDNKEASRRIKGLKSLLGEIKKILQNKVSFELNTPFQLEDSELKIARLVSYAPEIFRRSLFLASPKVIIDYAETCKNPISELCNACKTSGQLRKMPFKQLLLQASYNMLDASVHLVG